MTNEKEALPSRAPFQVLVLPFRFSAKGAEFAIFQRSDELSWQGIAGGGLENETPIQAARRETLEESGLSLHSPIYPLQAAASVPKIVFPEHHLWPSNIYVVPEYCFAVDAASQDIHLSNEHIGFEWLPFEMAYSRLKWDSNKTALWELSVRLGEGQYHRTHGASNECS